MNILNSVFLQLFIDSALLVSVVILMWRINKNLQKPLLKSHQDMMRELKIIMAETQASSENFLQALEKSRLALKEIAIELDLKEKRVKELLSKHERNILEEEGIRSLSIPEKKYQQVVDMIKKGYSEAQTAEKTGFAEAEVGLIIDLYRVKNEKN
jgi:hypothetical protein